MKGRWLRNAAVALWLTPLAWAALASLKPSGALFAGGSLLTGGFTLEHYRALFHSFHFVRPLLNSLFVAAATTLLSVVLGAGCAYSLARLRFMGRDLLVAGVLLVAMFPQISIVAPLYLLLRHLSLIDTFPGLILPYVTFAMPLTVWLLMGHFRALPKALEQAAWLDGATKLRALFEVVLPLVLPGLATTAILTFIYCWNEFLFALSFTVGPDHQTLPVAIALMRGRYQIPWGQVLAAAVVATVPVALTVFALQRHLGGQGVAGRR